MLLRTFTSRDSNLYVSLVRPHLEFASTIWNPHLKGDEEALERIQRKASRIPTSMRGLEYEDRLKIWGLTTLKERRVRDDLIQMYKVLEDIGWYTCPQSAPHTSTRGESRTNLRLVRERFPARACNDFGHFVSVRHEFFLNRTVERWNCLTRSQVSVPSLNSFKTRIDS
jgi:hypothetical protein